jgi:glycogen(starch) synthase
MPSSYAPNVGGVEEMTLGLARELGARGHGVRVVTARWPAYFAPHDRIDGIPVDRLAFPLPSRRVGDALRFCTGYFADLRQVRAVIQESRIDVVHAHCLGPNTLYAAAAARASHKPLVLTTHGELQGDDTGMHRSGFMRLVRRAALRRAAWVTGCSRFTLRNVPFQIRGPSSVVYNALRPSAFPAGGVHGEARFFLIAARLTHNKGVDLALRAFAAARAGLRDEELWIAGDGPERAGLEALSGQLGLADRVRFVGQQTHGQVADLLARSLLYLCPSRNEGFGLANLEAMSAKKAVVAFEVGGVSEVVIHLETGLLAPSGDIEAFGNAMVQLASDSALCERLGLAGAMRSERFNWPDIVDEYLAIYRAVSGAAAESDLTNPHTDQSGARIARGGPILVPEVLIR